jgi:hypothetical protein
MADECQSESTGKCFFCTIAFGCMWIKIYNHQEACVKVIYDHGQTINKWTNWISFWISFSSNSMVEKNIVFKYKICQLPANYYIYLVSTKDLIDMFDKYT